MNQELLISQTDMRTVKESTTMVYSSAKEIVNQYMNISIRTHYIEAVSKHSIKIRWSGWCTLFRGQFFYLKIVIGGPNEQKLRN